MPSNRSPWLLIGAFLSLYLVWGSTYLAIRFAVESWPPLMMAGIRYLAAGILLYAWLSLRGESSPSRREWLSGCLIGFLLLACGNGSVTIAEHAGVASGVVALAIATVPLFTLLFGLFWKQRARPMEWAGIALGLLGILLLNQGDNLQSSSVGAGLLIFSAAIWAFGSVLSRHLPMPRDAMGSAVQMLCGGLILLLGSALGGERLVAWPSLGSWLALGYLVFFGSLLGFSAYVYLLKNVRPAAATSYAYVNPVVAILLGIVFAGETMQASEWWAMLAIVSAVILIGLQRKAT